MKINYDLCRYAIYHQCMLQSGNEEDITKEEMEIECREYWNICPYSQFKKERND